MAKMLLKGQDRLKGDERILGDGEFVESVLERCNENYSRHQHLVVQGVDLKTLSHAVAHYFDLDYDQLIPPAAILPWYRPAVCCVIWPQGNWVLRPPGWTVSFPGKQPFRGLWWL